MNHLLRLDATRKLLYEMLELQRDRLRAARREGGRLGEARVWCRTLVDLANEKQVNRDEVHAVDFVNFTED